ncbi:MAG: retropepsin-like aspartic protease [Steroidobacteraceae bacterium]
MSTSLTLALLVAVALPNLSTRSRAAEPVEPGANGEAALYAAPTRLDRIGRILVPVHINGRGPYRFMIDTGASHAAVSRQLLAELGLTASDSPGMVLRGVTGSAAVPVVWIDELRAGALTLRSQQLPVLESTILDRAAGILGVQGFAGKRITIDFVHDKVSVRRSRGAAPGREFFAVPAQQRFGGLLVVDAHVGAIATRAIIDTGAERTLGNRELQRRLLRRRDVTDSSETEVFGATSDVRSGDYLVAPTVSLGEIEVDDLIVTFADLEVFRIWDLEQVPALLIGMDLLGTVRELVIDYRRSELQIRP